MIEQTIEFKYKKGQIVNYHPIINEESDGRDYVILNFWKSGHGQNVYELEGKSDCVNEEALRSAK